jgi:hypothetical protein
MSQGEDDLVLVIVDSEVTSSQDIQSKIMSTIDGDITAQCRPGMC